MIHFITWSTLTLIQVGIAVETVIDLGFLLSGFAGLALAGPRRREAAM
jgi:hypothetical protein